MFIVCSSIITNGLFVIRHELRVSCCDARQKFHFNEIPFSFWCRSSSVSSPSLFIRHIYGYSPRIPPSPSCCSGSVNVLAIASQLCRYLSVSINADECMLVCSTWLCMNVLLFLSACLPYNSRNNNNNNSDNKDGKFAAIGIFYAFTVFCCMLLGVAF